MILRPVEKSFVTSLTPWTLMEMVLSLRMNGGAGLTHSLARLRSAVMTGDAGLAEPLNDNDNS